MGVYKDKDYRMNLYKIFARIKQREYKWKLDQLSWLVQNGKRNEGYKFKVTKLSINEKIAQNQRRNETVFVYGQQLWSIHSLVQSRIKLP
ncbi:unnamed protein product [Paramecium octaurelia]|nr:unnamed protein product [Paramecium octaurelia]